MYNCTCKSMVLTDLLDYALNTLSVQLTIGGLVPQVGTKVFTTVR
jgi:hypothetical protein